jgi:hypothetical protein
VTEAASRAPRRRLRRFVDVGVGDLRARVGVLPNVGFVAAGSPVDGHNAELGHGHVAVVRVVLRVAVAGELGGLAGGVTLHTRVDRRRISAAPVNGGRSDVTDGFAFRSPGAIVFRDAATAEHGADTTPKALGVSTPATRCARSLPSVARVLAS